MIQQLELGLQPHREPARTKPAIDRLRAVLKRMGFDWHYRALKGSVLLRPLLGVRFGWQPMCGRFCCGDFTFERTGYFDRPPMPPEDLPAHYGWLEAKREATYALWGRPC